MISHANRINSLFMAIIIMKRKFIQWWSIIPSISRSWFGVVIKYVALLSRLWTLNPQHGYVFENLISSLRYGRYRGENYLYNISGVWLVFVSVSCITPLSRKTCVTCCLLMFKTTNVKIGSTDHCEQSISSNSRIDAAHLYIIHCSTSNVIKFTAIVVGRKVWEAVDDENKMDNDLKCMLFLCIRCTN